MACVYKRNSSTNGWYKSSKNNVKEGSYWRNQIVIKNTVKYTKKKYIHQTESLINVDSKIGLEIRYFCTVCTLKIRTSIFRRILSSRPCCNIFSRYIERERQPALAPRDIQYIPEVPYIISAKGKQTFCTVSEVSRPIARFSRRSSFPSISAFQPTVVRAASKI